MHFKLLKNKQKTKENPVLKNKKTQEKSRGRSMVEMLGVLAIIGVLSIGGISGYTIAMRKYRANEILNVASKYATLAWTQINQDALNNPSKYRFWGWGGEYDDTVGVTPSPDCFDLNHFCLLGIASSGYAGRGNNIDFSDMGLGALPSGANNMQVQYITASKSGLLVNIEIYLDSKKLCETLRSQVDYDKEMWSNQCNKYNGNSYLMSVGFPQN